MIFPEATYPDTLRAISIAGPFAYLIAIGEKPAEYRSWKTSFRGPVLLHVSLGARVGRYLGRSS
jgi:hypothetical protein